MSQQLVPYQQDGRWGYVSKRGKVVVPPQYNAAEPIRHGLGRVRVGNRYGYVDSTGQVVIPIQFVAVAYAADSASYPLLYQVHPELHNLYISIPAGLVLVMERVPAATAATRPGQETKSAPPVDEYPLGLYRPNGQMVLPVQYAYFRGCHKVSDTRDDQGAVTGATADYYTAGRVVEYYNLELKNSWEAQYISNVPLYEEQLLTRTGRLLLGGRWLPPVAWFDGQVLSTTKHNAGPNTYFLSGFEDYVLLDTTGRQLRPQPGEAQLYKGFDRLGGGTGLLLGRGGYYRYNPGEYAPGPKSIDGLFLFRRDGSLLTDKVFASVRVPSGQRHYAVTAVDVPGSYYSKAESYALFHSDDAWGQQLPPRSRPLRNLLTGGEKQLPPPAPRPLYGLLNLLTGEWAVRPQYKTMRMGSNDSAQTAYLIVQKRRREGIIDLKGNRILPFKYKPASLFPCYDSASNRPLPCWLLRKADRWELLSLRGRTLVSWSDTLEWHNKLVSGKFVGNRLFLLKSEPGYVSSPPVAVVEFEPSDPSAKLRWLPKPPKKAGN